MNDVNYFAYYTFNLELSAGTMIKTQIVIMFKRFIGYKLGRHNF